VPDRQAGSSAVVVKVCWVNLAVPVVLSCFFGGRGGGCYRRILSLLGGSPHPPHPLSLSVCHHHCACVPALASARLGVLFRTGADQAACLQDLWGCCTSRQGYSICRDMVPNLPL
jgi:hypothetical protein